MMCDFPKIEFHQEAALSLNLTSGLIFAAVAAAALTACNESTAPTDTAATTAELARLKSENETLKTDKQKLEKQVEELQQTPETLLTKVKALIASGDLGQTTPLLETMRTRFGDTPQLKVATTAVAQAQAESDRKQALAKELEARGFYAIKPTMSPVIGNNTLKVESLKLANTWTFDSRNDGEYHYRDAEKGSSYLLMNVTVHSTDKDPMLPEVAVYTIDGKEMTRVGVFSYEFRRWQSYGTFIGLYHDFKNDFARASAVPFNAAASVINYYAKKPFAVVATGKNCYERGDAIGQPNVRYTIGVECLSKTVLTIDDFKSGGFQVVSFFNRPKGV